MLMLMVDISFFLAALELKFLKNNFQTLQQHYNMNIAVFSSVDGVHYSNAGY